MEADQKWSPIRWNRKFPNNLPLVVNRVLPVLPNSDFCLRPVGQPKIGDVKAFFTGVCEYLSIFDSQAPGESSETGAGLGVTEVAHQCIVMGERVETIKQGRIRFKSGIKPPYDRST